MTLSRRAKEAIKTALALTIAMGISLALGWEKPYWAGFGVAMISLQTAGASLNKGFFRVMGTLAAAVVAFMMLSLFTQDRWAFIAAISLWVGFCVYRMRGAKHDYFWHVAAFTAMVLIVAAGTSAQATFDIIVARCQETGLGVLVYSLVTFFLWKESSGAALDGTLHKLIAGQHKLFAAYRELTGVATPAPELRHLAFAEAQNLADLEQALYAAESDTFAVWETRRQWRALRYRLQELMVSLGAWRESLPELAHVDLPRVLPGLDVFLAEIERRFDTLVGLLDGKAASQTVTRVDLTANDEALAGLPHFDRAAVTIVIAQLQRLERATATVVALLADIRSLGPRVTDDLLVVPRPRGFAIDPDRLLAAIRVMATIGIAALIWIYVDPPGHDSFVQLSGSFMIAVATKPFVPAVRMLVPFALGCVMGGALYMGVMPHLAGYDQLGAMLFLATFAVYFYYWRPQQVLSRFGAIVPILILTSIQTEQTYSFSSYANSTAMMLLALSLIVATAYVPFSPRAEKVFLRLLARLFRQTEYLLSRLSLDWRTEAGPLQRLRILLYRANLLLLPQQLAVWGRVMDYRVLPGTTADDIRELTTGLQALAFRVSELLGAGRQPQSDYLVQELLHDVRAWRLVLQEGLADLARDPGALIAEERRQRLTDRLRQLDARVDQVFRDAPDGALDDADRANFYRLIGAFRGVSEAGLRFLDLAKNVNWPPLREARF